jgi:hypothetical protein
MINLLIGGTLYENYGGFFMWKFFAIYLFIVGILFSYQTN